MPDPHIDPSAAPPRGRRLTTLSLAALGVVYGDIGTSPIYAIRESLDPAHGVSASAENVLGLLSLIVWSLIIVISIKYLFLVMRADNRGEGGIIALTALVMPRTRSPKGVTYLLVIAGLFGAALLYGDSMITPAISVLSAIEGLEVATPAFRPFIIPITIGILIALFSGQRHGTARVGALFGPVMMIWFATLGILGAAAIVQHPGVVSAVSPHHALRFFRDNHLGGFLVLGTVFLVVTGGEALYADMGHFGRRPIRVTWFAFVLPALLLNYFGQGALIIGSPEAVEQPFFLLAPRWALYPLVGLTTAATVIASQAVISGAFSLTRQAVLLGYLPRLHITHTSEHAMGQIYLPAVNWVLLIACVGLVLGFGSSGNLAAAYGVAVTTDMVFTTILFAVVAWRAWRWSPLVVGFMVGGLLVVDLAFWGANLPKIPHGGWFPLLVAAAMFTLMTTWKRGRAILAARQQGRMFPIELFVKEVEAKPPVRVPGTAVFMDSTPDGTPPALLHNLKHNSVLHETVVFLTILPQEAPFVADDERYEVITLGVGMYRVRARLGFMEEVNVPELLNGCTIEGVSFEPMKTSYFLGRERVIATDRPGMAIWREHLFGAMSRNAEGVTRYFSLPPNRVVELGMQVEI
ncbi:MAG: potassium transporter Kup [Gemmatimonadales bacterium]